MDDPVRATFNIAVIVTALLVLLWIITSRLSFRAHRNPVVILVMGFMLTLILWCGYIGVEALFQGFNPIELDWQIVAIVAVIGLIAGIGILRPENTRQIGMMALFGIWVALIGILAVIGLSQITAEYVKAHTLNFILVGLLVSLALQLVVRYFADRLAPEVDSQVDDPPQDDTRPPQR